MTHADPSTTRAVAMKVTLFYSWQSDLPNNTNRGFIERALEKAIASIRTEEELMIEPALERDTAGVAGTPDIAATIFRKIDECHIFVGDVSIINPKTRTGRKTPNPNVLLELGYAAKKLTWDNVICVFNTAFGKTEDLPFDLRLRRLCLPRRLLQGCGPSAGVGGPECAPTCRRRGLYLGESGRGPTGALGWDRASRKLAREARTVSCLRPRPGPPAPIPIRAVEGGPCQW
jgi:hypothetical protein